MINQRIKLDCGHEVEVVAIDVSRTYGEILVGSPSFEDNFNVYQNLKAPEHWGKRKTVMNNGSFDLGLKQFKKYTIYLWLSSNESINDLSQKFEGSEVVVVWAIDDLFSFSINSLIEEGIKDFDWEIYAVNTQI
jgi:hypothetical protein